MRKILSTALILGMLTLPTTGCGASQTTLADIVTTLGNTIAAVETLEGNSALAAQIQKDTAAAQSAVLGWKAGSPTQDVVQALNLVVSDLNLLPVAISPTDAALIALAVSTVEELLTDFGQTSTSPAFNMHSMVGSPLPVGKSPTATKLRSTLSSFKASRARIVAADPSRAAVLR